MKKVVKYLFFAVILSFSFSFFSCSSNKTGCPINENAHVKTDRKGNMSNKRGKTSLFPKSTKKRRGK